MKNSLDDEMVCWRSIFSKQEVKKYIYLATNHQKIIDIIFISISKLIKLGH